MAKKGFYEAIGENIINNRETKKISQNKLSTLSDVDRAYLGKIEQGKVNPSLKTLLKIANALGVDLCNLIKNK